MSKISQALNGLHKLSNSRAKQKKNQVKIQTIYLTLCFLGGMLPLSPQWGSPFDFAEQLNRMMYPFMWFLKKSDEIFKTSALTYMPIKQWSHVYFLLCWAFTFFNVQTHSIDETIVLGLELYWLAVGTVVYFQCLNNDSLAWKCYSTP